MIEVKGLTMRFGNNTALDGVDVCFGDNKIYGLLGRKRGGQIHPAERGDQPAAAHGGRGVHRRGAGTGERPGAGPGVLYGGEDPAVRHRHGGPAVPLDGGFYPGFDREYAGRLADTFGLPEKKKLKNLSTGYLTIAKLIAALASNAPYTLFDEPVLGLDANHREVFYRQLIESYSRQPPDHCRLHPPHRGGGGHHRAGGHHQGGENPAGSAGRGGQADGVYRIRPGGGGGRLLHGRDVLSADTLGGLKTACILGKAEEAPGLDVSGLDMQKLFIRLTNV